MADRGAGEGTVTYQSHRMADKHNNRARMHISRCPHTCHAASPYSPCACPSLHHRCVSSVLHVACLCLLCFAGRCTGTTACLFPHRWHESSCHVCLCLCVLFLCHCFEPFLVWLRAHVLIQHSLTEEVTTEQHMIRMETWRCR